MSESPKIYLIPTVIAENTTQAVIPKSVADAVKKCKHFAVENVRTARRCISAMQLGIEISSLHFSTLDKNTSAKDLEELIKPLKDGYSLGIMSEAGCPGIADPGALLVAKAHHMGIEVVPLVGPSSIFLALMASGFSGQQFAFLGYLPIDKKDRINQIKQLEKESAQRQQTQIFMDTPYRNEMLFEDLLNQLHPNTRLCVAKNITAQDEWIKSMYIKEWKQLPMPKLHKYPVLFLLAAY